MTKRCRRCGLDVDTSLFRPRKQLRDGLSSWCRPCESAAVGERRRADPEAARAKKRAYYSANPGRNSAKNSEWNRSHPEQFRATYLKSQRVTAWQSWLVGTARVRSRKYDYEFDLDVAFLTGLWDRQRGRCYWLGIELKLSTENRGPERPSLDRLDIARGYTRDNVVLACQFANMGRSTLSAERFQAFIDTNGLRR